ncbi:hypothetical protein [Clostridium tagluense]|uniref:hypothetical protein n=1 Tax=Clostridium tagluense TaxID=360422 RepID=UPI001CF13A6B|nr:hypothetical protein [Clostridium tagluense]MCB2300414.1 hypothetical protein [Clostridium tagluense]
MKDLLNVIYPMLFAVLTGVLAYIGREAVKLVPKVIDLVVAKVGLANYNKIKLIGLDVWHLIEEDKRLGKLKDSKITMFENLIKEKVPGITDADIKLIRQAIAGEINKDKPVIEKIIEVAAVPSPTTVAPILKYFALDGVTELTPVAVANKVPEETVAQ